METRKLQSTFDCRLVFLFFRYFWNFEVCFGITHTLTVRWSPRAPVTGLKCCRSMVVLWLSWSSFFIFFRSKKWSHLGLHACFVSKWFEEHKKQVEQVYSILKQLWQQWLMRRPHKCPDNAIWLLLSISIIQLPIIVSRTTEKTIFT